MRFTAMVVGAAGTLAPPEEPSSWIRNACLNAAKEILMQLPVQITFHGVDHSDALEERIRQKVGKLETIHDRITSCRVVIEQHHRNASLIHRKGEPFHVRIDVMIPGHELVVCRDPKDSYVNEDIGIAIRDAFHAMERQLKAHRGRRERVPGGRMPVYEDAIA
jgi:ribosome-associated translation inhibitor RaiA